MANDWIKMMHDLPEKPEVIAISSELSMDRFGVLGRLHRIWSWFDCHTVDGNASGVTPAFLDSLVAHEGFASAMISVGWLVQRNGRIAIPNFDRHISKSAKQRALGAERVKRSRNASSVTKSLPEKRREEKRRDIDSSNEESIPPNPRTSELFERFWEAFPRGRKTAKGKAYAAWLRAAKIADPEDIIAAAVEYAASPVGRGEFVKMPATWLNGECWCDDRESWNRRDDSDGKRREPGAGQRYMPGTDLGPV